MMAPKGSTLPDRFWSKVESSTSECWLWTGATSSGYGVIGMAGRYAHRLAYIDAFGAIPDGLQIDHVRARGCNHRNCVNPAHLEAVTRRENLRRGEGQAGRWRNTHCVNGHEFTPENTYIRRNGCRYCRACGRNSKRKAYRRLPFPSPDLAEAILKRYD